MRKVYNRSMRSGFRVRTSCGVAWFVFENGTVYQLVIVAVCRRSRTNA